MEIKDRLEKTISQDLNSLRSLLCNCSTQSVAGWCFSYLLCTARDADSEEKLTSPGKQIPFLLDILLSCPEPIHPVECDENTWHEARRLLDKLFSSYIVLYLPEQKDAGSLSPEWRQSREVAMLAFLHYFHNGILATAQQIADRIKTNIVPYDEFLIDNLSISASESLAICHWVNDVLQRNLDGIVETMGHERKERLKLIDRAEAENWNLDTLKSETHNSPYTAIADKMLSELQVMGIITLPDLENAFPQSGSAFWRHFSINRGDAPHIRYPTDRCISADKPLICISETKAICPSINQLFNAVLTVCERTLTQGAIRESYFRHRDNALEVESLDILKSFLSPAARIWHRAYETPDCHNEHDVVAVDKGICIVLEAKAKPPAEPFRDPDKSFNRLRNSFRADTGIQKAFQQTNRVIRKLRDGNCVSLYDSCGNELVKLHPDPTVLTVGICVTRDNYGALATNLSLLLEKDDADSFPWVVNVFDFSTLASAWKYFKWGTKEFRKYLEQRSHLHGKVFSDDELDYAGYYIQHGGFEPAINTKADFIPLNPDYSNVFDKIHRHLNSGGPPVIYNPTEPVLMDLRHSLESGKPVFVDPNGNPIGRAKTGKIGRNSLCPCGSGKKFKKCCGLN